MAAERLERAIYKARGVGLVVEGVNLPLGVRVTDEDGDEISTGAD